MTRPRLGVLSLLFCLATVGPAWGADVQLLLGGERVNKRVTSWRDLRREKVVMQALDYSCGAAALATVLRYGFAEPVTESELIGYIFIFGQTPAEGLKKYFKRQGFTLLDLKRAAQAKGYSGLGYKGMDLDDLIEFIEGEHTPVLAPIRPFGYNHFVVVRGLAGNLMLLADPARGNTTMTLTQFQEVWIDGIGFVVKPKAVAAVGRGESFHEASDQVLDELTAAGSSPAVPGADDAPSQTLLTARRTDPPSAFWRLQTFLKDAVPGEPQRVVQHTFQNPDGTNLISIFSMANFTGTVQLGRPAGNFFDFSPPQGQPIRSGF